MSASFCGEVSFCAIVVSCGIIPLYFIRGSSVFCFSIELRRVYTIFGLVVSISNLAAIEIIFSLLRRIAVCRNLLPMDEPTHQTDIIYLFTAIVSNHFVTVGAFHSPTSFFSIAARLSLRAIRIFRRIAIYSW